MSTEDIRSLNESYTNVKRICSILRVVSIVFFIFLAVISIALAVICLISENQPINNVIYTLIHGLMVCTVFALVILGLTDVIKSQSPFTAKQVKRLIIAGFIFLAVALVEIVFPVDITFDLMSESESVLALNAATTSSTSNVNVAALLLSFASFCLSAIFKYGIILQQLSDETV